MNILNVQEVKELLTKDPETEFSLQPIKVKVNDSVVLLVAGYHIYEGQLPKMIHVKGSHIWEYVAQP